MVMGDIVTGCEVLVVGGGPGGYTAAIRASQLGKDVILVDKYDPGGTCVYRGCIPTKSLIHAANLIYDIKNPGNIGIKGSVEFDYNQKLSAMLVNLSMIISFILLWILILILNG